jgi:hypothetical protein
LKGRAITKENRISQILIPSIMKDWIDVLKVLYETFLQNYY